MPCLFVPFVRVRVRVRVVCACVCVYVLSSNTAANAAMAVPTAVDQQRWSDQFRLSAVVQQPQQQHIYDDAHVYDEVMNSDDDDDDNHQYEEYDYHDSAVCEDIETRRHTESEPNLCDTSTPTRFVRTRAIREKSAPGRWSVDAFAPAPSNVQRSRSSHGSNCNKPPPFAQGSVAVGPLLLTGQQQREMPITSRRSPRNQQRRGEGAGSGASFDSSGGGSFEPAATLLAVNAIVVDVQPLRRVGVGSTKPPSHSDEPRRRWSTKDAAKNR